MAYRRKIIDRRTREGRALGRQLDTLKGVGILALIVAYLVFGRGHSGQPAVGGKDVLVVPAQAAPLETSSIPQRQSTGYAPFDPPAAASTTLAINSVPSQVLSVGVDAGSGRSSVPWRHVTNNGTRWSLRRVNSASLLLLVDLGGDQVAKVVVAPAFEDLNLGGMNDRVDHLQSEISQRFPLQTANYIFDRDGTIRPMP